MASSYSSYVKSEPNLSYTSIFDTSLEHKLPLQIDSIPPTPASVFIDAPVVPSNETPFDLSQSSSAPILPVYINMGVSKQTNDVDHPLPSTTVPEHSHHHLPYYSQNRNRYPYLSYYERRPAFRRPEIPKGIEKNE
jgi:hypothetical protein